MQDSSANCSSCGRSMSTGWSMPLCSFCLSKSLSRAKESQTVVASSVWEAPGHEMLGELARGGMGMVYRARQLQPEREVAVKVLLPQMAGHDLRERFRIEAKVMAELVHPAIVPIYQYGEHEGVPWISMAMCSGGSLASRKQSYAGHARRAAELVARLSEAVSYAHSRGVLHRDIKPGNVLFDDQDRPYLSDFGLAKRVNEQSDLTQTISLVGTPHYLAPELINNSGQATTQSDIYALGALLYELLAGVLPFDGQNLGAVLKRISSDEPSTLPKSVPKDLATVALKCLHKLPAQRYTSAQELAEDLRRWLDDEPITARRHTTAEQLVSWCRRKPSLAALTALLLLSVVTASSVVMQKNRDLSAALQHSRESLHEALLTRISSTTRGVRMQERDSALSAVKEAAQVGSTPELEELAASLLAMSSLSLSATFKDVRSWYDLMPNEQLTVALNTRDANDLVIEELPSRKVLAHLGKGRAHNSSHPFSRDGKLVLFDSDAPWAVEVRDWAAQRAVLRLPQGTVAKRVCFTPDGLRLAAGREDGGVDIYDLTHPEKPHQTWPTGLSHVPSQLAFSPDGQWLAIRRMAHHQVSVLDARTGQQSVTRGLVEDGYASCMEWFPDSTGMVIGSTRGHVRAWSVEHSGIVGRTLPRHSAQVYGLAIHPNSQLAITSAYDTQNFLIDWPSGRLVGIDATNSNAVRFSQDGSKACLYDEDAKTARFFEVRSSGVCRQFAAPEQLANVRMGKGSWNAQISPDHRLLAVMELGWTSLFDMPSARYLGRLPEGNGTALAWLKNGAELWIGATGGIACYSLNYDAAQTLHLKRIRFMPQAGDRALRLNVSEKADRWMLSRGDGLVTGKVSDDSSQKLELPPNIKAADILNFATLSEDGRWIAVSAEKTSASAIYDLQTQRWAATYKSSGISPVFSFMPDGKTCWTSSKSYLSRIDLPEVKLAHVVLRDRREPGMTGLCDVSADGRLFANVDGQSLCLRDGKTAQPFLWLRHPISLPAAWLDITPDGRWLTYSGLGQVQQVWDLARLEKEMLALGLPWRGPHFELGEEPLPVMKLVLEEHR